MGRLLMSCQRRHFLSIGNPPEFDMLIKTRRRQQGIGWAEGEGRDVVQVASGPGQGHARASVPQAESRIVAGGCYDLAVGCIRHRPPERTGCWSMTGIWPRWPVSSLYVATVSGVYRADRTVVNRRRCGEG